MNMNMNEVGWDGRDGFHFQHPLTLPFQVKSHKLLIIIKVEWQKKSATNSLLSFSHLAVWFHFCHTVWLVLIWWSVQPSANNNIRIQVKKNIIIVETLSVCIDLRLPLRNSSFMDSFNLSLAHSLSFLCCRLLFQHTVLSRLRFWRFVHTTPSPPSPSITAVGEHWTVNAWCW